MQSFRWNTAKRRRGEAEEGMKTDIIRSEARRERVSFGRMLCERIRAGMEKKEAA